MATESTAAAATRAALRAKALRDSTWRAGAETRRVRSAKKEKNRETERERERERERSASVALARARARERGVEHEGSRHTRLVLSPLFLSLFSVPNCVGSSYLVLLCVGGGPGDDPPGGLSVQAHAARSGHSRGHHHHPPPNSHFLFLFLWCGVRARACVHWLCSVLCVALCLRRLERSSLGVHQPTHSPTT